MSKNDYSKAYTHNDNGNKLYSEGKYEEAIKEYEKAVDADSTFYWAFNNLGLCYNALKDYDNCFKNYQKAVVINPNYADSLNGIGIYYQAISEYEKAEEYYLKTIQANPNFHYAYNNLGLVKESLSEYKESKEYFEKCLEINPDYADAKENLKRVSNRLMELTGDDGSAITKDNNTDDKSNPESFINKAGRNLNQMAKEGKIVDCIGREEEIITIFEVLGKRFKNNPVLIGHPGVGKTCIVEGIAKLIVEGKAPEYFKDKEIVSLNTGLLIAGTKYRGEFEIKIKKILEEAQSNKDIILFIDEIHTIMGAGRVEDSNLDIAQMLKPALQSGDVTCIGATTIDEYKKYIETDEALERRFYPVLIEEPSAEDTKQILYYHIKQAKKHYKVDFTKENVNEIVDLTVKYMKKRYLPDKAIDIFEKLGARKMIRGEKTISSEDIRKMVSQTARIEFIDSDVDYIKKLSGLEELLKKDIIGQDSAIESVCNIIRITKRRLDLKPIRPDGVFLLTGPTGVGKTFMAKCVSKHLYGNENKLIVMDMSEFSEPHSVSKLIGAPPGYAGFDTVMPLTEKIVNNPASVLVLDEIEKADNNVIKLFLQVFDEGRITDNKGKRVYFSEVTIFMTSNILTLEQLENINDRSNMDQIVKILSKRFPSEFLNRIDEIMLFNPLTKDDAKKIISGSILKENQAVFAGQGINLEFISPDELLNDILEAGYSKELGARNLHKTFEKITLSPIVKYIYDNKCKNTVLEINYSNKKFSIREKSNRGPGK